MKKLKTLGIVSTIFLVLVMAVFAVFAALGFFEIKTDENGRNEIIFSPFVDKNKVFDWQVSKTEGDITAVFKTSEGNFEVKLGDCSAAEKFIELKNAGFFDEAEFSVAAENMFIQTSVSGEGFSIEENEFGCINGAVGFVMEEGKTYPSIVIITAEELSNASKGFLKNSGFDEERIELYENFGGIPEYEGKIAVFGMISSGENVIEKIKNSENSGYTGGFSLLEPIKIKSVEISYPTEEN